MLRLHSLRLLSPGRDARILNCLIPLLCLFAGTRAEGQSGMPPLETFVIVKHTSTAATGQPPHAAPKTPALQSAFAGGMAQQKNGKSYGNDVHGDVALTVFPGSSRLETHFAGQWAGHPLDASLNPDTWFHNGLRSESGFLQVGSAPSGFRLGSPDSNFLETGRGLRFTTPAQSKNVSVGLGIYQQIGSSTLSFMPALDCRWQTGASLFGAQLGADASWRLRQRVQKGAIEIESFAEHAGSAGAAQAGATQGGTAISARLSGSSTLFQRIFYGPRGRSLYAAGGIQRVGNGLLTLDFSVAPQQEETLRQMTLGFRLPLRHQPLIFQYQQNTLGAEQWQQVDALTTFPAGRDMTAWLGEGLQWQRRASPHNRLTLGARFAPAGLWSLQAEVTQGKSYAAHAGLWRGVIGYQCSAHWQIKMLYGPSPAGGSNGLNSAYGLQLVHRFQYRSLPSGTVQGRVFLDGQPCVQPLTIAVDGQEAVKTGSEGEFQIRHLAVGKHSIGLALTTLPADLNPLDTCSVVDVGTGHTSPLVLRIAHVGQVRGHLQVEADEFGATDPTAQGGVTVMDEAGDSTTTDADGNFVIGNLLTGRHTLHLVAATLPPHFCAQSSLQVTADVVPGHPQPPVEFLVTPERRPVQFSAPPSSVSLPAAQGG